MLQPELFKTISANVAKDGRRDERLEQWRRLFDHIDTDGSGALSREELGVALAKAAYSPADISKLFGVLDANHDGAVDREEWTVGFDKYNALAHGSASEAELLRVWEAGKPSVPLAHKKSQTVIVVPPPACGQVRLIAGAGSRRRWQAGRSHWHRCACADYGRRVHAQDGGGDGACGLQRSASKVGLAVDEPPRLVFIGCTGCGKSSLCTALTGQLRPR
eukprot:SAG22_NODE_61_length_23387_cov_34.380582_5_plen_219_part_00